MRTKQWFTCDACGGRFRQRNTDEDCNAEMLSVMPEAAGAPRDEIADLCDVCYREFLKWFAVQSPEDKAAMRADYDRAKGVQ